MRDDAYTNPATIRAVRQSRGRNARLNVSMAESLGVNATDIPPVGGALDQTVAVIDPTLYADPGPRYTGSTFRETTYGEGSVIDEA